MSLKHQSQINKYLKWVKLKKSQGEETEVTQARKLNLKELHEDVDTVVSNEFESLESLDH